MKVALRFFIPLLVFGFFNLAHAQTPEVGAPPPPENLDKTLIKEPVKTHSVKDLNKKSKVKKKVGKNKPKKEIKEIDDESAPVKPADQPSSQKPEVETD